MLENALSVRSIASLPLKEKQAILNGIDIFTVEEIDLLFCEWGFWARPNQLPPPGDWLTWLILAGRGFGKTRSVTEFAKSKAQQYPGQRGAIVGATTSDVRDILIEGESGIKAISPPSFHPVYEPSKRRLIWPNGAMASLYSAEEPDRLRGPQFHWAICDELCFVAGTLISTEQGDVPIEQVKAGDYVHTRKGLRRVTKSWCSSEAAKVYKLETNTGRTLVGTANHPVWVDKKGFVPLRLLEYGDILEVWDIKLSKALSGVAADGGLMAGTIATAKANYCTGRFMPRLTDLSQIMLTSITEMVTNSTTSYPILRPLPVPNISSGIGQKVGKAACQRSVVKPFLKGGQIESRTWQPASNVESNTRQPGQGQSFVTPIAERPTDEKTSPNAVLLTVKRAVRRFYNTKKTSAFAPYSAPKRASVNLLDLALSVASYFRRKTQGQGVVRESADTLTVQVSKVNPSLTLQPVYNLEVEDSHEYYANGILVHNCSWRYPETWDMLMFGLRLGEKPQVAVATTPRPSKLIKELMNQDTTVVTRGTTYENKANLSPAFFKQVVGRYEGTRLGRQELNAEILDDVPGALWKRATLDDNRVTNHPDLVRIVVGVDPHATTGESGIVIAGKGTDGHGYVLDDLSTGGSPDHWARQVVTGYHKHKADRIAAEVNNGGDMVILTIGTIDKNVPVRKLWASRGKQARAEPVAALYEQGKVHHVGVFAALEDELCNWVPGEGTSPNRLDALVWALTEVMLNSQGWARGSA